MSFIKNITVIIVFFISANNFVLADYNSELTVIDAYNIWKISLVKPDITVVTVKPSEIPVVSAYNVWQTNLEKPDLNVVTVKPSEIPVVSAYNVWQTNLEKPDLNVVTVKPSEIPVVSAYNVWQTNLEKPDLNVVTVKPSEIPVVSAYNVWQTNLEKPDLNVVSVKPSEIPIVSVYNVWQTNLEKPDLNVVTVKPSEIPVVSVYNVWQTNLEKPDLSVVTVKPSEIPVVSVYNVWQTNLKKPDINFVSITNGKPDIRPYKITKPDEWSDVIVLSHEKDSIITSDVLYDDQIIYLSYSYMNYGDVTASHFINGIYIDDVFKDGIESNNLAPLSHGFMQNINIGYLSQGEHTIEIKYDYFNEIDEFEETNNTYSTNINIQHQEFDKPDIAPYKPDDWEDIILFSHSIDASISDVLYNDKNIYANFSFAYTGTVDPGLIKIGLYIDGVLKVNKYADSSNNKMYYQIINENIGLLSQGNHSVELRCDYDNELNESDEINNEYFITINVYHFDPVQQVTVLENETTYENLSNSEGTYSLYKINVPNDNYNLLGFYTRSNEDDDGDCDMYVKHGSIPNEENYDFALESEGSNENLLITDPAPGEWYIMLNAYDSYSNVSLHVFYENVIVTKLKNGCIIDGLNVAKDESLYFEALIPKGVESISIESSGNSGDVDLYAFYKDPDDSLFYYSETDGNDEFITIDNDDSMHGKWLFVLLGYENSTDISIQVNWDNNIPIAKSQNIFTDQNKPVNIILKAEDNDGDTLEFTILTQPSYGIVSNVLPNISYTPNLNFEGTDSITFKVNDGKEDSNIATIYIYVQNTVISSNILDIDLNEKWSLPDIIYGLQILSDKKWSLSDIINGLQILSGVSNSYNDAKKLVGLWNINFDWDCNGSDDKSELFFKDDFTFTTSAESYGIWNYNHPDVTIIYDNSTTYSGEINSSFTKIEGSMVSYKGSTGCWDGVKENASYKAAN